MFNSAYETLPCKLYRLDDISKQVERLVLSSSDETSGLSKFSNKHMTSTGMNAEVASVINAFINPNAVGINIFIHPLVISNGTASYRDAIVSDCRDVVKVDSFGGVKITAMGEYSFHRVRNYLQGEWHLNLIQGATQSPVNNYAMLVFSRLIADAFTMRFNLDLLTANKVQALAAFHYYSMHQKEKEIKDYELPNVILKIAKATRIPSDILAEVINELTFFSSIEDFCDKITEEGYSTVFAGTNPTVVYGILRRAWMGKNAPEIVAVSLEHPPTFEAMLHIASTNPSYAKTGIGIIAKKELRSRDALSFIEKNNRLILGDE